MPELPEVETIARTLAPSFIGHSITALWCNWPRMLSHPLPAFKRRILHTRVTAITRRAKYIVFHLQQSAQSPVPSAQSNGARRTTAPRDSSLGTGHREPGTQSSIQNPKSKIQNPPTPSYLLMHLRMSGRAHALPSGSPPAKHVHLILRFADGPDLHFDDARKFGRVLWTPDLAAATSHLGLEPLESAFTPDALAAVLTRRCRQLKPALLDQSLVAGLGNIYTDETLHRARLHPLRKTDSLRPDELTRLHEAIIHTLQLGITHNGASLDWVYPGGSMQDHFTVYGRTHAPCPRCRTPIQRIIVSQRGTHLCPRCQPTPRRPLSLPGRGPG